VTQAAATIWPPYRLAAETTVRIVPLGVTVCTSPVLIASPFELSLPWT
jgi:hypothetical protein